MKIWIKGARLRTLPLAVAPVIMGAGTANMVGRSNLPMVFLALAVALFLQIGVNFANDYSDGIRGTDKNRVGPQRLTGGGLAKPKAVRNAAFICFALAAVAGLVITVLTQQWWFIAVGLVCIVAAWFYTGGKRPYGYAGLGEVVVFIFFGLVATIGTDYIQVLDLNIFAIAAGCIAGCFATAVLLINNIRDIETDIKSNKKTLAARIGRVPALVIFDLLLLAPFAIVTPIWFVAPAVFIVNLLLLVVIVIMFIANLGKTPKDLILALQLTSFTSLLFAIAFSWGLNSITF
ncbi:MAG: 1,4-dihydroxy-2-naphthoate polyprenyltransferase [Micrococcales bacterium]|nr:1,4-dihydroxy-2-naphthoate polyprenyltransferase [Micrococcales bacterium]NBR55365.1 1,4-dihydroxy-2-naphthoate polyprenyltransferase [Micrococcales bacterium]NBR62052.1 1,4-dihydroxy-2-naphthoate polyprenyltransferase [Actinomycetota bacterium]NBT49151.1 1,4-dihydroxy-2-naphthoate polyprenyltransferase [Actinomycetota bacterium]NBY43294.1 1,4-dihydroxy-2-naphthoate polyprenyltransferase [Micrococcales bacterium]